MIILLLFSFLIISLHPSVVGPASLPLLFSVSGLPGSSDSVCNHHPLSQQV